MNRNEERKVLIVIIGLLFSLCCIPTLSDAAPPDTAETIIPPQKNLVVAVYHDPPFMIKNASQEWSGLNIDIWRIIAADLGVPYQFRELPVREVRQGLIKRTIDIASSSSWITAKDLREVDFTVPTGSSRLAVAVLPDTIDHPWLSAVKLFFGWGTLKIIALLLIILVMLGTALWLIERRHNPAHFDAGLKGIGSGIYWIGSVLTSGNCMDVRLMSTAGRALGLLWMFICALALTALIASVTTALNESTSSANLITQKTLCTMKTGAVAGSRQAAILHSHSCPVTEYPSLNAGLEALLQRKIQAFAQGEITLSYLATHEYRSKFAVCPTDLVRMHFAFELPKESPWRTRINSSLVALMERPDWTLLLHRYGLNTNMEGIQIKRPDRRVKSSYN